MTPATPYFLRSALFSIWAPMFQKVSIRPFSHYRSQASRLCGVALLSSALLLSACDTKGIEWPDIPGLPDFNATEEEKMANSTSHMKKAPPPPPATKIASGPAASISASAPTEAEIGYNTKNIFGKSLRSDGERLDRLERAVQDMRNEFDSVRPSIKRLMAVESDIQNLIGELQQLSGNINAVNNSAPPPQPARVMNNNSPQIITPQRNVQPIRPAKTMSAPKKTYQKKSPPPVSGGKATVYDVRVGEHPGKSRIVLDVNTKTGFNVDIDNNEKIMIVELPDAGWSASMSKNFGRSPVISSYAVEPSDNGHMLIFQLKKAANITYKDDISALSGSGRRIVIDLNG